MIAIISDIHSNIEALTAVFEDIEQRRCQRVFCLGDVIGYGPNPDACLDLIGQKVEVTLMGNHDFAVLYEPNNFNVGAEGACYWTRQYLAGIEDAEKRNAYWKLLGSMPVKHTVDASELGMNELTFVHGSPRRPVNEYLFPDDIYNAPTKLQGAFDRFNGLCFVGHTHVPGCFFLEPPDFYSPDDLDDVYEVEPDKKVLINVGSVGQPRDRDNRASYVMLEPGQVRFCRVEYDIDAVAEKVRGIDQLDDYLGIRLKEGR
jgi:predicted phosphodiesterase